MAVIEVSDLARAYRTRKGIVRRKSTVVEALAGISFAVERGELFGLLGPNGAGKTTTIKILTTLLLPSSGSARVLGFDPAREPREVRRRIGQLVGLKGRERERVETYSRGMRQRLHVARGLLHEPEVIFLDEPTIGLDPVGARELRDTIAALRDTGTTILLTTHYMYEADELCQRLAVISDGRFVAEGTPAHLKGRVADRSVVEIETFGVSDATVARLGEIPGVASVSVETRDQAQVLLVQAAKGAELVQALLRTLDGTTVGRVISREPTLEDAYVELVRSA